MVSYMCGYFRHYYPIEFITSYLNNANNDEDIKTGTELCGQYGIYIKSPKFGKSKGKYYPSKSDNSIYKGIGSIKYLNETIGDSLYSLSKSTNNTTFIDLLVNMQSIGCDSRQTEILIKLDFFDYYGKANKLLNTYRYFQLIQGKKAPKKSTIEAKAPEIMNILEENSESTAATFKNLDWKSALEDIFKSIPNLPISFKESLSFQQEVLGYIDYKNDKLENRFVLITEINTKYSPVVSTYCLKNGKTCKCKISKKIYSDKVLNIGDVIYIQSMEKKIGYKKVGEEVDKKGNVKPLFEKDPNKIEWWINSYSKINIDEVLDEK